MQIDCKAWQNSSAFAHVMQWQPTREGYLKFLVESKLVYDALEQVVQEASVPECESHLTSSVV